MTFTVRRAVAAAAALGIAGGTAGAIAADRDPPSRPSAPTAVAQAPAAKAPPSAPLSHSDVRIDARTDDPGGGAPWAMRTFASEHEGGQLRCAQLGRLQAGRFGWITPDGRFRPARFDSLDVPTFCDSERFLKRIGAQVSRSTLVGRSDDGAAVPATTITYGLAASPVREVTLEDGPTLRPGRDGAILQVRSGEPEDPWVSGRFGFADGRRLEFDREPRIPDPPRRPGRPARERPVGTPRVSVRVPDPGGGLPWALLVSRGSRGGTCFGNAGRLLGTRLGTVDPRLGLFNVSPIGGPPACPTPGRPPSRDDPAPLQTGLYSLRDEDPAGRNQLRREDARTILSGPVDQDVVAVTIRTPRDVRTLVPSPTGHAVLAVYDGTFPRARITVTALMRDGRRITREISDGGA